MSSSSAVSTTAFPATTAMIIGQKQTTLGGSFDAAKSMNGRITDIRVFDADFFARPEDPVRLSQTSLCLGKITNGRNTLHYRLDNLDLVNSKYYDVAPNGETWSADAVGLTETAAASSEAAPLSRGAVKFAGFASSYGLFGPSAQAFAGLQDFSVSMWIDSASHEGNHCSGPWNECKSCWLQR